MTNDDPAALRAYHAQTKHSVASVTQSRHGLDFDTMPRPFKIYPELDPIPLPRDFDTAPRPALAALGDPGQVDGPGPALDIHALARLLFFTAGIVRTKTYPAGEMHFRAAACTGALYHIDLYVVCGPLDDLPAGVYHFGPHDFALRRLRDGDHRAALVAASGGNAAIADAPVTLVLTSTFWRNSWKYRSRAYRHAFWDAGTLLANLLAVAAASRLPVEVDLGWVDADVDALVGIDGRREASIAVVPLGRGLPVAGSSSIAAPIEPVTLPYSSEQLDYPAIEVAHRASALESPTEAASWRAGRMPAAPPRTQATAPLPPDTVLESIETVILRRGSARRFPREAITAAQLATILACAVGPIPSDFDEGTPRLADLYVIVNAVEGVDSGAYVHQPETGLVLLQAGDFRGTAGHLDLGQPLAADAAVNCYWLSDLDPVLARFGNRGYRAAQLEAAIAGGRTYLAAYALGLAATGLTFFDDDVTAFFSPHAAGKSVMFLTAIGRRARRA
ncbi:MAG TPA: SagB family peptide dehydrogenase [Candidatus Binatia bacterium]|jgi:SagB-type dehydrogenase family enzyme|nr:SagB family peptide dehydrogenase [Candidatus Binatia bacterium]